MKRIHSTILITIVVAVLLYAAVSLLALVNSVRISLQARGEIATVLESLENNQLDKALKSLFTIESQVNSAESWAKLSFWLTYAPVVRHDYIVYHELLSAGGDLTTAAKDIVSILSAGNISQQLSLETLDLRTAPAAYLEVHPQIMTAFDHIAEASQVAENIHVDILPPQYREDARNLQARLLDLRNRTRQIRPLLESLPTLLGADQPFDILVLLQNTHELRPTGGFIGTYGLATIDRGNVTQFYTDDIYNLDARVLGREEFIAPEPIRKYTEVENWYLRDANWSPDFPTAALDVKKLYEFESGQEAPDAIIAITPYIVQRFLEITGPVEVDDIFFTPENLIDAIQFRVEQEFWRIGLSDEERKVVINNLAQVLKQRLFNLSGEELKTVYNAVLDALDRREILLYTDIPEQQELIKELGWDGAIEDHEGDFIYVVDANLGALKTDRLMERSRHYDVAKDEQGRWVARLDLTYKNNGFFDYRTTRYRTYTRVYVPVGSQLISSTGFTETDKSNVFVSPQVYSEFNKQVFAGFISVEPSQSRTVTLQYYLPPRIAQRIEENNKYRLYVQRQPGVGPVIFSGQLSSDRQLFSFAPSDINYKLKTNNTIEFTSLMIKDQEYTVSFK